MKHYPDIHYNLNPKPSRYPSIIYNPIFYSDSPEPCEIVLPQYLSFLSWFGSPMPDISFAIEPETKERKIDEVLAKLKAGVEDIQNSDNFRNFLLTLSKFHDYSIGNTILIMLQFRNATQVAGFNTWKELGRFVKAGEHGIMILAPCLPPKTYTCSECNVPISGESQFRSHLATAHPGVNITSAVRQAREGGFSGNPNYFKVVYVFDISQTSGKDLPNVEVPVLTMAANETLFAQAMELCKVNNLSFTNEARPNQDPSIKGMLSGTTIWVRPEEARGQQLKTLLHELGHFYTERVFMIARTGAETIAESSSFVVAAHFGFDTGSRSFGYVATWSQDKKVLERNLTAIRSVASRMIEALEKITVPSYLREGEIIRFYRNKLYIGVRDHEKDSFGNWEDVLSIKMFGGKPDSLYSDEIYEYSESKWNELIERVKKQAEQLNREFVQKPNNMATSYPIWHSGPTSYLKEPFVMKNVIHQFGIGEEGLGTKSKTGITFFRGNDYKPIAEEMKRSYPYKEMDIELNNPIYGEYKEDLLKRFGLGTLKGDDATRDIALKNTLKQAGYDGWVLRRAIDSVPRVVEIAVFKEFNLKPPVESSGPTIATALSVTYNGPQMKGDKVAYYTFTDPQTGSTFGATDIEEARKTLAEMREKFGKTSYLKEELSEADFNRLSQELAELQRGAPESAMLRIQMSQLAQLYGYLAEHVGDLTHRMAQHPEYFHGGEGVAPKVRRTLALLNAGQDKWSMPFEKDYQGQIRENLAYIKAHPDPNYPTYKYRDFTFEQALAELKRLGQDYANEHKKLPVINDAQKTARDAAVAIGEFRFNDARQLLQKLQDKIDSGFDKWQEYALSRMRV
jgi:hypothetical protein